MMLHVSLSHSTLYSTGPVWCLLIKNVCLGRAHEVEPFPAGES